ncbi:phospholipase/Carboxylesterase [Pirellula staleyi DSM 6068]|uniref:Phospholipase/Carboxylesterase n=1 Tax=Pirellula staleyi (strain ATCC 27377 / DSM 6068 / ICPB 4128) TaxID=530564 RepID=D2R1S8_PIRSD|nr:prolyl oligopeptidase family serine peptidase [Pirellula staleyi]ADB16797.1 phospholipase/Carboxylesterase [Pirellula staleyi DSM 6068]
MHLATSRSIARRSTTIALLLTTLCLALLSPVAAQTTKRIPPIPRVLPPPGIQLQPEVRERLEIKLADLRQRYAKVNQHPERADVDALLKSVEFAIEIGEFYNEKEVAKAEEILELASLRLASLVKKLVPWQRQTGLVVRGFHSAIDGSPQPYGLVIPEKHDFTKPVPLYVWLHGRGDKATDLHFVHERMTKTGQISPPGAIVLHAFGRQCVGFKSAGEIDVLEAIAAVEQRYSIDPSRIVMMGFSMGGAGAWHLGAHYADKFVAVAPGAGFAETARYVKLTPQNYPPKYEQLLWGAYDVPGYVRNLFNTTTIAYSGELDKQIQAARVMEEAFTAEGKMLTHLIGPGVEHKYEPKTLEKLLAQIGEVVAQGKSEFPSRISLQTRTLRYSRLYWVEATGLARHWEDSRIDAELDKDTVVLTTKNIRELAIYDPVVSLLRKVNIDGTELSLAAASKPGAPLVLRQSEQGWEIAGSSIDTTTLRKFPKLQGPIDDAFMGPFLVVTPTGKSQNPRFQAWVDFELAHLRSRWKEVMRGTLPEKADREVTADDLKHHNLILFGDSDSNYAIERLSPRLPIKSVGGQWTWGDQTYDGDQFVPAYIFPSPLRGDAPRYVVLNSGLTFREAHDKTNSQQNPKLPDWAILDLEQTPSAISAGKVVEAGFFGEQWERLPAVE